MRKKHQQRGETLQVFFIIQKIEKTLLSKQLFQ